MSNDTVAGTTGLSNGCLDVSNKPWIWEPSHVNKKDLVRDLVRDARGKLRCVGDCFLLEHDFARTTFYENSNALGPINSST